MQAEQIIVEGLSDPDPRIRVTALDVVSATRQTSLMPRVQGLLGDPQMMVRFHAAIAVGDMRYVQAMDAVSKLLNDPDTNIRMAAGYAMTRLGRPEHARIFRDAITSQDQTVRGNAALLLGKSADPEARKLLYWALQRSDSDDKVVWQAAESIARLGDERIYPKLATHLTSPRVEERAAGVRAMSLLNTAKAKNAVVTKLDDPALEVRLAAAGQLGRLGDSVGETEVQQVFDENLLAGMDTLSQEQAKILTASAIGEIGTPALVNHLPKLLADPAASVRLAAAKAVFQTAQLKK